MILGGILSPIENVLEWLLRALHESLQLPWAWSIVGLVVIVRVAIVPLAVRQIHSMQALQAHAPQMKEIQKKYAHDKQRQQEELMRFYKENKINPAASCLPMVVQIPIFISLFYVLRDFEKTVFPDYPGSDLGWLGIVPNITRGITTHWSGVVLLVIYVASQMASTFFMSTTMQRSQRILMLVLPLVFVVFIIKPPVGGTSSGFPVGLLIYWVTTNLWTVGQGLITRRLLPKPAAPEKRSSRTPAKEGDAGAGAKPQQPKPQPQRQAASGAAAPRPVKRKRKGQARR